VELDVEDHDTHSDYDNATNYRFTPTVAGKYLFQIQLMYFGLGDDDEFHARLYKNGSLLYYETNEAAGTLELLSVGFSVIVDANGTTDYFEVFGNSTGDKDIRATGSGRNTFFSAVRVR